MNTTDRSSLRFWTTSGFVIALAAMFAVGNGPECKVHAADESIAKSAVEIEKPAACCAACGERKGSSSRLQVLVGSLTVFTLAVLVGFEIIAKVPPTLHTPLMSGSNAVSGITIVGALLAAGHRQGGLASLLGVAAIVLANINVVGGFLVTHRMLLMFKKK